MESLIPEYGMFRFLIVKRPALAAGDCASGFLH